MLLRRALAFFIDLFLVSLCFATYAQACGPLSELTRFAGISATLAVYFTGFYWAWNGETPGGWIFRLKVVHPNHSRLEFSDAVLRTFGVALSYLLFGFGFSLALVRLDQRNLSDLISGTNVKTW